MKVWSVAVLLLSLVSLSDAQNPMFTIEGTVQDSSKAVLTEARVTLRSSDGESLQTAHTDGQGRFRMPKVKAGTYQVEVSREGFATKRFSVQVDSRLRLLTLTLPVATVDQSLNVGNDTGQVTVESAANRDSVEVDQNALENLPIFDQDYVTALSMFLDQSVIATGGVSLVVDGVESSKVGLSPSAVERVKINNDPYAAEYFRPGRGRIEIITKQTSPEFHGTTNFIFRDYHLNASDRFASSKPPEQRRIYEGSLIGPIGKSGKTSFLISGNREEEDLQSVIFARDLFGAVSGNVANPRRNTEFAGRISHVFNDSHNASFQYSFQQDSSENQGVGGTVLSSVGTNTGSREDQYRYTDNLLITPNLLSQIQIRWETNHDLTASASPDRKIVVLDSFTGGGAQGDRSRTEKDIQFNWVMTWSKKKHTVKAGINIPNISRRLLLDSTNAGGTFFFSDLAAYAANLPYAFTIQRGNGRLVYKQDEIGGFIQDEIRVRDNLSLMVGLRYDWQNAFRDDNNFAPRFSFAYAPGKSRKLVIRGGAGAFYDRTGASPVADLYRFDGGHLNSYVLNNPSYPDPFAGGIPLSSDPSNRVVLAPDVAIPYTLQYGVGVEQQIRKMTISAGYRGSQGIGMLRSRDINAPLFPYTTGRPNPLLGTVRQIESTGTQESNALEISLKGKINRFINGQVQYTLSKTMNDTNGVGYFPANSYDLSGEWGRSDFDQRHRLSLLEVVNAGRFFNLGVGLSLNSGRPYTITTGLDQNLDGFANERPAGIARNSAQGPGYADLDLRWSHDFRLAPTKKEKSPVATIAVDSFNVINRTNYGNFVGNLRSPFFGQAVSTQPARRLQFTARYKF